MFGFWIKIKDSVKRYLERLADANQKEFGDSAPDCCKLNRHVNNKRKK